MTLTELRYVVAVADDIKKPEDLIGKTIATANPTLTLAALSLRTADHILKNVLR